MGTFKAFMVQYTTSVVQVKPKELCAHRGDTLKVSLISSNIGIIAEIHHNFDTGKDEIKEKYYELLQIF